MLLKMRVLQTAILQDWQMAIQMTSITNAQPGVKFKVENKAQYEEYLQELEPIREELGIPLKEAMYPDAK